MRLHKKYHKPFWWTLGIIAALMGWYFITHYTYTAPTNDKTTTDISTKPFDDLSGDTSKSLPKSALIKNVPFTSQAPFGGWDDPRQQDACEETSVLMAGLWAQGIASITPTDALDQILKISAKAEEMFGTYHDSSAEDTLKLYHAYFGLDGEVKSKVKIDDIKSALASGRLVAVPTDGRKLGNPNFTGGGPDRHFLVIIGYDDTRHLFTTNDPGTRKGANYKYSYDVLMNALQNYPTGDHLPLFKEDTAMIIFAKKV